MFLVSCGACCKMSGAARDLVARRMSSEKKIRAGSAQDIQEGSIRHEPNGSSSMRREPNGSSGSSDGAVFRPQFLMRRKSTGSLFPNIFGSFLDGVSRTVIATSPPNSGRLTAVNQTEDERKEADEASSKIAKFWWRRRYVDYMDKNGMIARLELEDSIGRRSIRLLVNSLIFVFLVRFLSLGNSSTEKLSVRTLLTGHLFNLDFYRIRTLDDLRDYLPVLSEKARKFSVSAPTESRAVVDETLKVGSVLQGQRELFSGPLRLYTFQPRVTSPFTLSAWVEHPLASLLNTQPSSDYFPILRQPMSSGRSLSCWGWFYPPQLRYGGHDFYSPNSIDPEVVVRSAAWRPLGGEATHEVITVDQDTVTFYTNGEMVGQPVTLPRKLTECQFGAPIEMGDENMALSSFKFYQRAFTPSEVSELYLGGQPLVELAAGVTLQAQATTAGDVTSVATDSEEMIVQVDGVGVEGQIRATMGSEPVDGSGQKGWIEFPDPTFPPDPSPPAWLPGGARTVEYLSAEERAAWERGNRTGLGFLTERWSVDEQGKEYYSVFEDPIYGDGTQVATLPQFDASLEGATISFWLRALNPTRLSGPHVHLFTTEEEEYRSSSCRGDVLPTDVDLNFRMELDWATVEGRARGQCKFAWWFLTWFNPTTQSISEDFLISSFAKEPRPLVWRHAAYQYNASSGGWSFYLDGGFVFDSSRYSMASGLAPFLDTNVHQMLSGTKLAAHSWVRGGAFVNIPAKIAQFRVYTSMLSPAEILAVQDRALWPVTVFNEQLPVKECIDPETDFGFFDTSLVDRFGHTCQWHQSNEKDFPYICNLPWLKRMCPVTCSGRRTCHNGQLSPVYVGQQEREAKKHYVFDRIMHIVPRNRSVICPRDDIDIPQAVAECREKKKMWGSAYGGADNYSRFYDVTYSIVKETLTDLRECDQLEAALYDGFDMCSWPADSLTEFEQEVQDSGGEWAVNFWIRPKEQSTGMPANFWFAVNLYSSLVPPLVLSHWHEIQPDLEPWMDARSTVLDDQGWVDWRRAPIWPTTSVDYTEWSMMHMQLQKHNGKFRLCATLNSLPMECTENLGPPAFQKWSPAAIMRGVELSTEMLVSPFEFSTQMLSPSQVQQRYYRDAPQMALKLGPNDGLQDRRPDEQPARTSLPDSDVRIGLLAPPVLFQARAKAELCTSKVVRPFIDAQLSLLDASFCFGASCQDSQDRSSASNPRTVATCSSKDREEGTYWGRTANTLRGEKGFSEFLSVIADNDMVVRTLDDDESPSMLQTRYFLDALTTEVHVVLLLLNPNTGLISLLDVVWDVSLPSVKHKIKISHLGTVMGDERWLVWREFIVLAAMIGLFAVLNLSAFVRLRKEAKRHKKAKDHDPEFSEVIYGLLECCMVGGFAVWWLLSILLSEDTSTDVVKQVAGVPWTSQTMAFDTKVSSLYSGVSEFDKALDAVFSLQTFAFFLLLFMLLSIMQATAVHPKMRALTGSFKKSMDDLWHFGILAAIIFVFFATTGWWTFGGDRDDFRTGTETMTTQLNIILGTLPENYNLDFRLSVYVMLTTAVFFLLMLNFLLAIVVEGYMKVRGEMEENKAAYEFFTDIALTAKASFHKHTARWPDRRELIYVLKHKVSASEVNGFMLRKVASNEECQITIDGVRKVFDYYFLNFPKLRTDGDHLIDFDQVAEKIGQMHGLNIGKRGPSAFGRTDSNGDVSTDTVNQNCLERILLQMETMNRELGRLRDDMELIKRTGGGYRRGSTSNGSQLGSQPYHSIVSTRRRLSVPSIEEDEGGGQHHHSRDPLRSVSSRDPPRRRSSAASDQSQDPDDIRHRKLSITCISADLVMNNSGSSGEQEGPQQIFSGPVPVKRHFLQSEDSFSFKSNKAGGVEQAASSKRGFVPQPAVPQGSMRNQMRELSKMASYCGEHDTQPPKGSDAYEPAEGESENGWPGAPAGQKAVLGAKEGNGSKNGAKSAVHSPVAPALLAPPPASNGQSQSGPRQVEGGLDASSAVHPHVTPSPKSHVTQSPKSQVTQSPAKAQGTQSPGAVQARQWQVPQADATPPTEFTTATDPRSLAVLEDVVPDMQDEERLATGNTRMA